ncbi:MAG: hypothetical protein ACE5EE_11090 [Fidelibacterota bacterium]
MAETDQPVTGAPTQDKEYIPDHCRLPLAFEPMGGRGISSASHRHFPGTFKACRRTGIIEVFGWN